MRTIRQQSDALEGVIKMLYRMRADPPMASSERDALLKECLAELQQFQLEFEELLYKERNGELPSEARLHELQMELDDANSDYESLEYNLTETQVKLAEAEHEIETMHRFIDEWVASLAKKKSP